MNKKQNNLRVYFCGISKNCINNVEKNLTFLNTFNTTSDFDSKIIIVDSDSVDGTKEVLRDFSIKNSDIHFINYDFNNGTNKNRIEKIANSRNECLKRIDNFNKETVYIPLDLDIDLFAYLDQEDLENLITKTISFKKNIAIFPFSTPYYYDIFALRASNWVNFNAQFWVSRFKKYLRFGSFVFNYMYIFRHQISKESFKLRKIQIKSAFGGMGIYYFKSFPKNLVYEISDTYPNDISEHIFFNKNFKDLEIDPNWNLPAPPEHLEFKLLNKKEKVKYIFKSLFYDFVN